MYGVNLIEYTAQVYFGSTIANVGVWMGMCLIGIKLWSKNFPDEPVGLRRNPVWVGRNSWR